MADQTIRLKHNRKTYEFLQTTDARINLLYGGAGSGKSWSIAQYLLFEKLFGEHGIRILAVRKTGPHLRKSSWLLTNDMIDKYDLPVKRNKTDLTISTNSNTMFFAPLDDPQKLKSMEQPNYIWAEEATELTYDDYKQLNLRCRGPNANGKNKLFYSFNPDDEHSFLHPLVDDPPDNTAVNHSTYKDNAFLEPDYVEELERLKEIDLTYWKIYGEGVWASPENIIYTNWDIIDEWPDDDWFDEVIYGVDFGYNNPTVIAELGLKDEEVWERERLYETKMTNADLIEYMESEGIDKNRCIYADAAEPQRIEEIERAGFRIYPSRKGKNSVQNGIDVVKRRKRHVYKDSVNAIKEDRGYKWREDRDGNVLDEPVKFRDHFKDAERYALDTHLNDRDAPDIWEL